MPDYSKTVIYRIKCKDESIKETYIGHTTNYYHRFHTHQSRCIIETDPSYNLYLYKIIRDFGGWDNWDMEIIIEYPCKIKREAELKEREYIETIEGCVNYQHPTRSKEEYRALRKEERKLYQRDWWAENGHRYADRYQTEEYKEYKKQYQKNNKLRISNQRSNRYATEEGVAEDKRKKSNEHYHANKDEINRKRREKTALKRNVTNLITEIV